MEKRIQNVTQTLHDLIKALPAIKAQGNAELTHRHLQLIAYFQNEYDLLVNPAAAA